MGVNLTVQIPDALFEEARAAGILNDERIAALLAMELRREAAWVRLSAAAKIIREAAEPAYGTLSDDEVMQLVDEEIHLMRAEDDAREGLKNNPVP
jgi:hypothetical protein